MTVILFFYMVGLFVSGLLFFNNDHLLRYLDFLYVAPSEVAAGATRDWMFEDWCLLSRLGVDGWIASPVALIQTLFFPCLLCWGISAGIDAEFSLKKYNRFVILAAMTVTAIGHATIIQAIIQGSQTIVDTAMFPGTTNKFSECFQFLLFRPLLGKVFLDPPTWWMVFMALAQGGYILLMGPTDIQSGFIEALNDKMIHQRLCLIFAAIVWLECSRRADFIKTLVLCRLSREQGQRTNGLTKSAHL